MAERTGRMLDNVTRASISGALAAMASLALIAGGVSVFVPSESPLGPLARILDSLAPWILGLAALGGGWLWLTGGQRLGAALTLGATIAAGDLARVHQGLSLPLLPDHEEHLRVVFFNAREENRAFADRIVTAALEAGVDVMIFAEARALTDALPRLERTHAILTRCSFEDCPLLIASRLPARRSWQLTLNPIWPDRYAVAELALPGNRTLFLSTAHLVKPFFSGVAETELARLAAQYDWLPGPVLAVGDFNAAPWSRPIRQLLSATGYRTVRAPVGTWPAAAGNWGVPIDQALVHNGVRIVTIAPFGDHLNSNHRGLLLDVWVPDESNTLRTKN